MFFSLLGIDIQLFYWLIGIIILYVILTLHLDSIKEQVLIEGEKKGFRFRMMQKESLIRRAMDIALIVTSIIIIQYFVNNRTPVYIFRV